MLRAVRKIAAAPAAARVVGACTRQTPAIAQCKRFSTTAPDDKDVAPLESSSKDLQKSWSWVPPRSSSASDSDAVATTLIPVIPKQLLSMEEIMTALQKQGGQDVIHIKLKHKLDTITDVVIASASSRRLLRKMADTIVTALKERELKIAPGITGAEGEDEDDWLLVDCYDSAVHLMLPETREALKLEEHLNSDDKPAAQFSGNEEKYEQELEKLLEKYPVPENYNVHTSYIPQSNDQEQVGSKRNNNVIRFPKSSS